VNTKQHIHLNPPSHTTLLAIDGLYSNGKDLIAVQNSQWGMIDKDGHIPAADTLKQLAILKIALVKD
jgi:hypothetical protein